LHSIRYDEPYIISSWVDHLLLPRTTKSVSYVEIIKSSENFGDHNCLKFNISAINELVKVTVHKKKVYQLQVNWLDPKVVEEYSNRVEAKLSKLDFEINKLEKLELNSPFFKAEFTRTQYSINDALVSCKTRPINLYAYTKRPKKKYGIKSKEW
jgi:hypothetical protein